MRPRRLIAPRDTADLFENAVRERALAVLTFQQNTDWVTFKSRFLECDSRGRYFVLDYLSCNGEPLPPVTPGQYMGVTFRAHSRKILFATIVEAKGHFVLEDKSTVPAIRFRWPNSLTELQRRAYQRTPVPDDLKLLASLWRGGLAARAVAQSSALEILTGDIGDVSCGGAMIRLHHPMPPPWSEEEQIGLELQMPDGRTPVQVDARYRGLRPDLQNRMGAAMQFIGLEVTLDGRVALQRLAAAVQRLYRQGLARSRPGTNQGRSF